MNDAQWQKIFPKGKEKVIRMGIFFINLDIQKLAT